MRRQNVFGMKSNNFQMALQIGQRGGNAMQLNSKLFQRRGGSGTKVGQYDVVAGFGRRLFGHHGDIGKNKFVGFIDLFGVGNSKGAKSRALNGVMEAWAT